MRISVWYIGKHADLYPMVMIKDKQELRYYYKVSFSSLKRITRIANRYITSVFYNGWTSEVTK
jgi:hypothetical protein